MILSKPKNRIIIIYENLYHNKTNTLTFIYVFGMISKSYCFILNISANSIHGIDNE